MEDELGVKRSEEREHFIWPAAMDQVLRDGARRGRNGSHAAIQKVLAVVPELSRAEVQNRIRKLKNPLRRLRYQRTRWTPELDEILRAGYVRGWTGKRSAINQILIRHPEWPRHVVWRRAIKLGLAASSRSDKPSRWSENDDRILLDHAGYDLVGVIGELLNRTENAVRCRLSRLGQRSKVSDGYTRKALAKFLHVSPRMVLRWIMLGWLKVRNARISGASLESFAKIHAQELGIINTTFLASGSLKCGAGYTWSKVAKHFRVKIETVEEWIRQGYLKFCDPHITERSFEDFCKKHGAEIRLDLLGKEAETWLVESMGLVKPPQKEGEITEIRPVYKHTLTLRSCPGCRRTIRGNSYFRHVAVCTKLALQ